jgi:hypothetical protein
MASVLYPKFKEALLQGTYNLSSAVVRAVLIDTGTYTYDAAHNFYDDLAGVVGTESGAFASKTFTNGTFSAANITFSAVTGATVEAIVLFVDTGTAGTDALIAYIDSASSGLPVTPNGGDIAVTWSGSGIFSL